jgi:hypothetical protein
MALPVSAMRTMASSRRAEAAELMLAAWEPASWKRASKSRSTRSMQQWSVILLFFICVYVCVCVCVCTCIYMCVCIYIQIYIHVYIDTHQYVYTYMYAQQHAGMVRVGCLSLSCNAAVVGASHDLTPSPAPATRVYTQDELKQLYLQQQKKSATTSFSVPSTLYGLHHTQHPIQAPYGGQATYGGGGECAWGSGGGIPVPPATAACSPSTASPSSVGALVLAPSGNLRTIKQLSGPAFVVEILKSQYVVTL